MLKEYADNKVSGGGERVCVICSPRLSQYVGRLAQNPSVSMCASVLRHIPILVVPITFCLKGFPYFASASHHHARQKTKHGQQRTILCCRVFRFGTIHLLCCRVFRFSTTHPILHPPDPTGDRGLKSVRSGFCCIQDHCDFRRPDSTETPSAVLFLFPASFQSARPAPAETRPGSYRFHLCCRR